MSTYGDMQTRIADELSRSDLSVQIKRAILSAIAHYENRPFWFNEVRATAITTADAEFVALPPDYLSGLTLVVSVNGRNYPLTERPEQYIDDINWGGSAWKGYPTDYALYDRQIRLYPIPNGVYSLTLSYSRKEPALVGDTDTNNWMTEGEELIRCRAKKDVYASVIRDQSQAAIMQAMEAEALEALTAKSTRQVATGRLRPTQF